MQCLECGCVSDRDSFKYGCPMCGNWDSWMLEETKNCGSDRDDETYNYYNEDPEI